MQKKIYLNTISYLKLIKELFDEIGIIITEAKNLVDTVLAFANTKKINYKKLKEEILTFILANMFFLISKL